MLVLLAEPVPVPDAAGVPVADAVGPEQVEMRVGRAQPGLEQVVRLPQREESQQIAENLISQAMHQIASAWTFS